MKRIVLPNDIEVVVSSWGGVGTTFLLSFISEYLTTNDPHDGDGFKHSSLPPISLRPDVKFIYIYGDPRLAVKSLFRRGFQEEQYKKISKWNTVSENETVSITSKTLLEEYLDEGVDRFYLREHFENWYSTDFMHKALFLRYETIFDNVKQIIEFLELPSECILNFPKQKQRESLLHDDKVVFDGLNRIYGALTDELSKLDDLIIREPESTQTMVETYGNDSYLNALTEQCILADSAIEDLTLKNKTYTDKIHISLEGNNSLHRENLKLKESYTEQNQEYNKIILVHQKLEEAHQELEKKYFESSEQVKGLIKVEQELSTRNANLIASTSWKLTRPLRWLSRKFRVINE